MVWVNECVGCVGGFVFFGFCGSNVCVFVGDVGDDWNGVVNSFDIGVDQSQVFVFCQEGVFVGMVENDKVFYVFDGNQLFGKVCIGFVIDFVVGCKGGDGGWVQVMQIYGVYLIFFFDVLLVSFVW